MLTKGLLSRLLYVLVKHNCGKHSNFDANDTWEQIAIQHLFPSNYIKKLKNT